MGGREWGVGVGGDEGGWCMRREERGRNHLGEHLREDDDEDAVLLVGVHRELREGLEGARFGEGRGTEGGP